MLVDAPSTAAVTAAIRRVWITTHILPFSANNAVITLVGNSSLGIHSTLPQANAVAHVLAYATDAESP